jgi:hypothetical protein
MSAPSPSSELRMRNLRMLAGLGALFVLPLLLSFWMYYGTAWRPAAHVNHGELITPARPLAATKLPILMGTPGSGRLFHRKWSIVYIGAGQCDENCRNALYVMRQTRLALNNEMTRVDRVFLVTANCCDHDFLAREHGGMVVVDASGPAASALLQAFPGERENSLFIVDPLGNLLMRFDTQQNAKGLLQDLQKLLRLSSIG